VNEPGDHPAAPGSCIQFALLQDAAVPRSADEVANVFDCRGGAFFALDGKDILDGRIGSAPARYCVVGA
jgi:hypothetical protein